MLTAVDIENIHMISSLTSCSDDKATSIYLKMNRDVVATIDAILEKPVVSGEKYIPKKPLIETGLTQQQAERCIKGRDLQDKINAVFSVAHSKTQTLQDHEAREESEALKTDPSS